jgi:ATP synthase protein I
MVRAVFKGRQSFLLHFRERWMPNDARNGDKPDTRTAEEAALSARLRHLGDRLGQHQSEQSENARAAQSNDESVAKRASGMALGFRLSSELVAGVLVGGGIGWGLDRLLGISPWGLIVFLLLGFTAGVLNVMRSAGVVAKQSERL